jgi:hypothetical protein
MGEGEREIKEEMGRNLSLRTMNGPKGWKREEVCRRGRFAVWVLLQKNKR